MREQVTSVSADSIESGPVVAGWAVRENEVSKETGAVSVTLGSNHSVTAGQYGPIVV
jgi:hypothetical protein